VFGQLSGQKQTHGGLDLSRCDGGALDFLRFFPPLPAVLVTAFFEPFLGADFAGSGMMFQSVKLKKL